MFEQIKKNEWIAFKIINAEIFICCYLQKVFLQFTYIGGHRLHIDGERNHWHSGEKSWHESYAIKHYTVHDFHTPMGVDVEKKNLRMWSIYFFVGQGVIKNKRERENKRTRGQRMLTAEFIMTTEIADIFSCHSNRSMFVCIQLLVVSAWEKMARTNIFRTTIYENFMVYIFFIVQIIVTASVWRFYTDRMEYCNNIIMNIHFSLIFFLLI